MLELEEKWQFIEHNEILSSNTICNRLRCAVLILIIVEIDEGPYTCCIMRYQYNRGGKFDKIVAMSCPLNDIGWWYMIINDKTN